MEILIYSYLMESSVLFLVVLIFGSLLALSKGADVLVDNSVGLSLKWGISKMVVGATIISLGTTLPEITVSVSSSISGNPDLALGNAIGSIIVNTGLIIGIASMVGSLPVEKGIMGRQLRLQLISGFLLAAVSLPFLHKGNGGTITRGTGVFFLVLLFFYIVSSIRFAGKPDSGGQRGFVEHKASFPMIIKIILGLLLVFTSSKILIPCVEIMALRFGIPQSVIAATLVALGTSLPELVTAVTASRKGYGELALGNVMGANVLNVIFVVGGAAAVSKNGLPVPINFYRLEIPVMLLLIVAFTVFAKNKDAVISKREGIFLAGIYFIYFLLNYSWV
ncbi:MAG: sodium:calcium antiporter [Clostridia bacterium]|nr:sodium:calcium antiporter [Clostridia bacterium]